MVVLTVDGISQGAFLKCTNTVSCSTPPPILTLHDLCVSHVPPPASFTLEVATASNIKTLEHLQHRMKPDPESYVLDTDCVALQNRKNLF